MATTCAEEFTTQLETQSIKITCHQDFIFDGSTINANSDFSNLEELKIDPSEFGSSFLELHFQASFMNMATFENQEYTFTVTSKTDDGLDLENQVTILINLLLYNSLLKSRVNIISSPSCFLKTGRTFF